ncbi:MAG TPA: peptidoglycan-binding protein [Bacteroidales bacterium]|nr:peptidoglycan-binding protein [Bacteroidales bacterium]
MMACKLFYISGKWYYGIMEISRITHLISGLITALLIMLFTSSTPGRVSVDSPGDSAAMASVNSEPVNPAAGMVSVNAGFISRLHEKGAGFLSPRWDNSDKILQVISAIYNSPADGLDPDDYNIADIEKMAERIASAGDPSYDDIFRMERLLDEAFIRLSTHLGMGKASPDIADPEWKALRRNTGQDWEIIIENTLNADDPLKALQRLTPRHHEYQNLKKALQEYRRIESAGGWGSFTTSLKKIEMGMRHPDVASLRKRLAGAQGPIEFDPADEELFDQTLHDQVVVFQQRNGLEADGVVGKSTVEALNIPVSDRISAIEANLERWRWVNDDLGDRYVMVNTADYTLRVFESGELAFTSKAIVGTNKRQTPVFSSVMKYMVVNPDWTVPPQILRQDVIPDVIRDSAYLQKKNMKIFTHDGSVVDPSSIDWQQVSPNRFPYMIKQEPGKANPLGEIKFMFPNQYDVYIHDTPSRWQFSKSIRPFSSGCIRINNVRDFARFLLKDDTDWNMGRLDEEIDNGRTRTIVLKEPVPVHILYFTAWADNDGTAYFGKDIYNRDRQLIRTLKKDYR